MKEGRPSLTALWVAAIRAGAGRLSSPYRAAVDDVGLTLLPPIYARLAETVRKGRNAGFFALDVGCLGLASNVVLRTLRIDDVVLDAARRGVSQVVLLGAGYDARAYRLPLESARVFEVDFPATQAEKRRLLEGRAPLARGVHHVGIDFERDDLGERLSAHGFAAGLSSVWVWEGVTMYLTRPARQASLHAASASMASGSELVLTYARSEDVRAPLLSLGKAGGRLIGEDVSGLTTTDEMHTDVQRAGLDITEDSDGHAWGERYWPKAPRATYPRWERILVARKP